MGYAKTSVLTAVLVACSITLSGCTNFTLDSKQQDRNACDYISKVMEGKNWATISGDGTLGPLADVLEKKALPLASMHFGEQLKSFIDAARKTSRQSLFAKAAGVLQLETYAAKILSHCVRIEMN